MSVEVERFTQPLAYHGEGPVWYREWAGLRFVDMLVGDVVCLDTDGKVFERIAVGNVAAAFRPRHGGGMVAAAERGFVLVDAAGGIERLPELWDDTGVRMNEGGCDPDGRFYCGSMAYDMTPGAGRLYRLDADGSAHVVLTDVTCSNGLAWSPDGSRAYYVDSMTYRIDVFDYDSSSGLTGRRPLVNVPTEDGVPDGLTVDRDGGIWVAFYGGSAVRRYLPDGTIDVVLDVPVKQVTACTFGGADLDELYITTSREGLGDEAEPYAGSVFVARPGVRGMPVTPFAG